MAHDVNAPSPVPAAPPVPALAVSEIIPQSDFDLLDTAPGGFAAAATLQPSAPRTPASFITTPFGPLPSTSPVEPQDFFEKRALEMNSKFLNDPDSFLRETLKEGTEWEKNFAKARTSGKSVEDSRLSAGNVTFDELTKGPSTTKDIFNPKTWGVSEWLIAVSLGLSWFQNAETRSENRSEQRKRERREDRLLDEKREFLVEQFEREQAVLDAQGGPAVTRPSSNVFGV